MKKYFVGLLVIIFGLIVTPAKVLALQEWSIEDFNEQVVVNKDSTIDVTETVKFKFNGLFHTVFRKYPLVDQTNITKCQNNLGLQCAGFDYINFTDVNDLNGQPISTSQYSFVDKPDEQGNVNKVFTIDFGSDGRTFNNEIFGFTLKYRVYGAVGFDEKMGIGYLYFNSVPKYDKLIKNISINNTFPTGFTYNSKYFTVYPSASGPSIDYYLKANAESVQLNITNFMSDQDFTYAIGFPKTLVDYPATIQIASKNTGSVNLEYDGMKLENVEGSLKGIPTGNKDYTFSAYGYEQRIYNLTLASGETKVLNIELQETMFAKIMRVANYVFNCVGLLLMPIFVYVVYRHWKNKGQDASKVKVIVPYYRPPENIPPYLMGTIKDETVDVIDITSTLIDVAYRGYIKIKELAGTSILGIQIGNKDYELNKLKDFDDLTANEKEILNAMFDYKDRVTTSSLQNKFYLKVSGIKSAIYSEMKEKGYFNERPDHVRRNYTALGVVIMVIGIGLTFFNLPVTAILMYPIFLTISLAVALGGLALTIAGPFMPARTLHGSKIYEQLLGFKMYMEVAERFRVQDLTPETFEKYLSYAMIFGIEKKWGERFKDIYKSSPSWFEGSNDAFSTIYLVNALSSFNTNTAQAITSVPSSKSGTGWGSSGSGWSGGGGFSGGFSGGGFGGGSGGIS
jgi:uncharacterized membrane protein YgcG